MKTFEPITRFDLAFSLFCLQHRFCVQQAYVSKAVSRTGDGHLYLIIGVAALLADKVDGYNFLIAGLLGYAIELPIYWCCKNSFRRRRPIELSTKMTSYITPSDKYSLPSGHTAGAFLMATLLGHFYPMLYVAALIWAACVGLSRLLLGVHFFTDIIFGALLGIGCATLVIDILGV